MLKSPEEYLSALEFDAGEHGDSRLDAVERAFVEKYLGLEILPAAPRVAPEPADTPPQPEPKPLALPAREQSSRQTMLALPEIVVVPDAQVSLPRIEIAIAEPAAAVAAAPPEADIAEAVAEPAAAQLKYGIEADTAEARAVIAAVPSEEIEQIAVAEAAPAAAVVQEEAAQAAIAEAAVNVITEAYTEVAVDVDAEAAANVKTEVAADVAAPVLTEADLAAEAEIKAAERAETAAAETAASAAAPTAESLRERLRREEEIQVVSFFVAGQIFLLPVMGIQEVLRQMEIIKVPQAPEYVAGAINLRGTVMPAVRLAALLTNEDAGASDDSNFMIITGTESSRMGLIIDKVNSMHVVRQGKIIWNPESKLAEAAEFLSAIVDIDDRIFGMISPEAIARLILPEVAWQD